MSVGYGVKIGDIICKHQKTAPILTYASKIDLGKGTLKFVTLPRIV